MSQNKLNNIKIYTGFFSNLLFYIIIYCIHIDIFMKLCGLNFNNQLSHLYEVFKKTVSLISKIIPKAHGILQYEKPKHGGGIFRLINTSFYDPLPPAHVAETFLIPKTYVSCSCSRFTFPLFKQCSPTVFREDTIIFPTAAVT